LLKLSHFQTIDDQQHIMPNYGHYDDEDELVTWPEIYRSAKSGSGMIYGKPRKSIQRQQDSIFTSASGSALPVPKIPVGEQDTSIPISEQPDPSLNSESPRGWDWRRNQKGQIIWGSAVPLDVNKAKQTTILEDRDPMTGQIRLFPVFSAHKVDDPIRLDSEMRSALLEKLTKNINTLNPSACLEAQSTRNYTDKAKVDTAFLHQALNSLSGPDLLNLGGMRFRQALPDLNCETGHHYSACRETEFKGWRSHHALRVPERLKRVFEHVTAANKKIDEWDDDYVLEENEEME